MMTTNRSPGCFAGMPRPLRRNFWPFAEFGGIVRSILPDGVGTLMLATGLYGVFGGDDLAFAETVDLHALGIPLVIFGVLLIAPFVAFTISHARTRR